MSTCVVSSRDPSRRLEQSPQGAIGGRAYDSEAGRPLLSSSASHRSAGWDRLEWRYSVPAQRQPRRVTVAAMQWAALVVANPSQPPPRAARGCLAPRSVRAVPANR